MPIVEGDRPEGEGAGADGDNTGFEMLGEEVLYRGWVITLTRATFRDPEGTTFDREVVRHPGAVALVPVTDTRSVVLVRQYRPPVERWLLEIPAGTCDVEGEPELTVARRELAEEVGYAASDMTLLTRCAITPGFCDELSAVYLATGLTPVALDRQGIEERHMTTEEVPLEQVDALIDDGSIIDATTILGLGLAARRLNGRPAGGRGLDRPTVRPLSNGAEEYLSWLAVEKGRSRNTVVSYRRDIAAWEGWARQAGVDPAETRPEAIERHLAELRTRGHNPASIARSTTALRGLFGFLAGEGLINADPTTDIRSPRLPHRLPKALDEDEALALLDSVSGTEPRDLRDRALLELLYGTGARISEVVGLSLSDLQGDDGLLRVFGKGAKERLVPVGAPARMAVDRWLSPAGRPRLAPDRWRRRDDAEAVFINTRGGRLSRQGAWAIVSHHAERAGLGAVVSPHVLRHSCASHMLAHGADIRVVQELLGHVSIATTQIYTKLSQDHLRRSYDRAHPWAGAAQLK